jgi:hypothetical protein
VAVHPHALGRIIVPMLLQNFGRPTNRMTAHSCQGQHEMIVLCLHTHTHTASLAGEVLAPNKPSTSYPIFTHIKHLQGCASLTKFSFLHESIRQTDGSYHERLTRKLAKGRNNKIRDRTGRRTRDDLKIIWKKKTINKRPVNAS